MPAAKAKILRRWQSIRKHATYNIDYGVDGSYGDGSKIVYAAAHKSDPKFIVIIDEILLEVLKD